MALGGTGFVRAGPAWRAIDHVSDLAAQPYDELWIVLGVNDAASPPEEIQAAALQFFIAARRLLPHAPIIVFGAPRDDSPGAVRLEQTILAAFRRWRDGASAFVPFQTPSAKLFTGSLEGGGDFTADRFGGGVDGKDGTHPNRAGHRHMGGFVARARRNLNFV